MTTPTPGSCLCGAVRFRITAPFRGFQYCHCSRCRKASGSAHCANIFVSSPQFEWLQGADQVGRFEPPDAKYFATCFCRTCGSAMPWRSRKGTAFIVPAGALDEDPGERPTRNVFWDSRAAWYEQASELPIHGE